MKESIQKHKNYLVRCLKGFDSSLKAKGITLYSIIQDIDNDSSISEDEIRRKYDIFYNKTMLLLQRTRQNAKISWLDSHNATILMYLYLYSILCNSVYNVDDSLIRWYKDNHNIDDLDLLHNNDLGHILFCYKNIFYSVEIFSGKNMNGKCSNRHVSISNVYNPENDNKSNGDFYVTYAFDYETDPSLINRDSDISVVCNDTTCPRWKQSISSTYQDSARNVFCSLEDCNKCNVFNKCNVLRPEDALIVVKAIYECMLTREKREYDSNFDIKKYEHIPLPERDDDVVIYFGEPKSRKSYKDIGLISIKDSGGIVSSHASPREHHRKCHNRHLKSGKVVNVRETVVNKGKTKTSYVFKERS